MLGEGDKHKQRYNEVNTLLDAHSQSLITFYALKSVLVVKIIFIKIQ